MHFIPYAETVKLDAARPVPLRSLPVVTTSALGWRAIRLLLGRKHHAMADRGVIDRKALRLYKEKLKETELSGIQHWIEQLESAPDEWVRFPSGS
jgi:hypothetical protein